MRVLSILPEEPSGHGEADEDYEPAQHWLRNAAGEAGGDESADGAGDHGEKAIAPDDLSVENEEDKGDAVGHGSGDDFEGVDLVEVFEAEERELSDDEKAGT